MSVQIFLIFDCNCGVSAIGGDLCASYFGWSTQFPFSLQIKKRPPLANASRECLFGLPMWCVPEIKTPLHFSDWNIRIVFLNNCSPKTTNPSHLTALDARDWSLLFGNAPDQKSAKPHQISPSVSCWRLMTGLSTASVQMWFNPYFLFSLRSEAKAADGIAKSAAARGSKLTEASAHASASAISSWAWTATVANAITSIAMQKYFRNFISVVLPFFPPISKADQR